VDLLREIIIQKNMYMYMIILLVKYLGIFYIGQLVLHTYGDILSNEL